MKNNREELSKILEKRGYKNEDLINEIEQIYNKQQLPIHVVGSSLDLGTISIDEPVWGSYGLELMFEGERGNESTFLDKEQALKIVAFLSKYL